MVARCRKDLDTEPAAFKWLIISLHTAWQGAMVCHLTGIAGIGALSKRSAESWLAYLEKHSEGSNVCKPFTHLATAEDLYKRLQNQQKQLEPAGSLIPINPDWRPMFTILNELRAEFLHFKPKGWSIEISGTPTILISVTGLIRLIKQSGWAFRHFSEKQHIEFRELLDSVDLESEKITIYIAKREASA